MYSEKAAGYTRPDVLASATGHATPPISERESMAFTIAVTDPVLETVEGVIPGTNEV